MPKTDDTRPALIERTRQLLISLDFTVSPWDDLEFRREAGEPVEAGTIVNLCEAMECLGFLAEYIVPHGSPTLESDDVDATLGAGLSGVRFRLRDCE